MISFRLQGTSNVAVILNGIKTNYMISKDDNGFYSVYYFDKGAYHPLRNYWSQDKTEVIEDVKKIVNKRCSPDKYSKLYYKPA